MSHEGPRMKKPTPNPAFNTDTRRRSCAPQRVPVSLGPTNRLCQIALHWHYNVVIIKI
jgi:hypothetical protein